jgi:hypothetical protein
VPQGVVIGGASQCQLGSLPCGGTCQGGVGPSPEICDGVDNDCNGLVDDNPFGVGLPCGANVPPCQVGSTVCVAGALECQQPFAPQPEVCDGIDNDCDGFIDDAPLADGPLPGQNGCWQDPGNCCSFGNLTWCPPQGAGCFDLGSLSPSPCHTGTLLCAGAAGWTCVGAKGPSPETCDGLDNDCNGSIDDGSLGPPVGDVCGSNVGECETGLVTCFGGVLDCAGDVPPLDEVCDGLDNNCNGVVDDNVPAGGPCTPEYDQALFPGPRDAFPCHPGFYECAGVSGLVCIGGVAPQPEICDGIDNDCDGEVDESGDAPDGVDGSANPLPPPDGAVGDACGGSVGACSPGVYACVAGAFVCLGGQDPVDEECDCEDNDCNGVVDNQNGPGGPPLCSPGKQCVSSSVGCQCAEPCQSGEFKCALGQKCEAVVSSETGEPLGTFCVTDFAAICAECPTKTVTDATGRAICAPEGAALPNCRKAPPCVCKDANGCQNPCFGVVCPEGQICADFGPNAGSCGVDNCYNNVCQGCGEACSGGLCVPNPCTPQSCPPDEVCKPDLAAGAATCVDSCADVTCDPGERCREGDCVPTCDPACGDGQVCDESASPPACVAIACQPDSCLDGAYCDPLTGVCGDYPCEGVLCPEGQACSNGECVLPPSDGAGGGDATTTTGGGPPPAPEIDDGIYGLATGGGGCMCRAAGGERGRSGDAALAVAALAGVVALRRRGRRAAEVSR